MKQSKPGAARSIELLEPRQFFSTSVITVGDAAGAAAPGFSFVDADGTKVVVKLKGGNAVLTLGTAIDFTVEKKLAVASAVTAISSIAMEQTTIKSQLTITPTIPFGTFGADNRATIGSISSASTAIGAINANRVDVTNGINISGAVKSIRLGNLTGQLNLGGDAATSLTLAIGAYSGTNVTFTEKVKSLTATSWTQSDTQATSRVVISAPSFGAILITRGELDADILASTGSIGSITVIGGSINGDIKAPQGSIGNITARAANLGSASEPEVEGGDITSSLIIAGTIKNKSIGNITAEGKVLDTDNSSGGFLSTQIQASGTIGNIRAGGGSMTLLITNATASIKSITVVRGNLTGTISVAKIGAIFVKNGDSSNASDATITSAASVGNITIAGGTWSGGITAGTSVGKFDVSRAKSASGEFVNGNLSATVNAGTSIAGINMTRGTFSATLIAGTKIGAATFVGAEISGSLSAADKLGKIVANAIVHNFSRVITPDGEGGFIEDDTPGSAEGGPVNLAINVTSPSGKAGPISSKGLDLTITGTVAFDPNLVKISSKAVTFVTSVTTDIDEVTGKPVTTKETGSSGGTVDRSGLVQG